VLELAPVLGQEQEPVPVLGQELELVQEQVPVQEPVPVLGQELEPRRQVGSQLTTIPAGLIIFSFSSEKLLSFRFWPAKITLLLKAITSPFRILGSHPRFQDMSKLTLALVIAYDHL